MKKACEWNEIKNKLLEDPETRREYEALEIPFEIASLLIELRVKHALTQDGLAKQLGTKQSAIARLESGEANPSLKMLERIATATGTKLQLSFKKGARISGRPTT